MDANQAKERQESFARLDAALVESRCKLAIIAGGRRCHFKFRSDTSLASL